MFTLVHTQWRPPSVGIARRAVESFKGAVSVSARRAEVRLKWQPMVMITLGLTIAWQLGCGGVHSHSDRVSQ